MQIVNSPSAPAAIGPYSQAIRTGNLLFASGQIPLDPETMKLVDDDIETQTRRVIENMKGLLGAESLTLANIVKNTVFLKDMNDFAAMNGIYTEMFGDHKPARSTIQVAKLPLDARVEIECVAEFPAS